MNDHIDGADLSNREAAVIMLRAFKYVAPFKQRLAVKILFTIVSNIPMLLLPWPAKILIDHVVGNRAMDDTPTRYPFFLQPLIDALNGRSPAAIAVVMFLVITLLMVLVGAWSREGRHEAGGNVANGTDVATRSENDANAAWSYSGGLFGWIDYRWTLRLTHSINHYFRSRLFESTQRLPMTSLDDQRIGDAVYRVMYDTPAISFVCYRLAITPLASPFILLLPIWVMTLSYGHVPVVIHTALAVIPVTLIITFPFSGAIRRRAARSRQTGATTTTTMEESIQNVLAVQSLGGQELEKKRFDADSWRSYSEFRGLAVLWVSIATLAAIAAGSLGLNVFYELSDQIFVDKMTIGDMAVVFAYYAQIVFVATNVGQLWIYLQTNVVGMQRVFDLIDTPPDHQPDDALPISDVKQGYVFDRVSFAYPDGTRALKDVSLQASRGTLVALAGPAGAGKTTLAYMFPRFLSPDSGHIEVDGVELQSLDREQLRSQVAFVFQEPALFDASVGDNIRMGKPDASDAELREAAEQAGALEFIEKLPKGFDTPLGRGGGRLSVGQKQRLSIARALVRKAPVLILDEPTAALDPITEMRLVATLREASRDRLVLVIAHRLSTIRHADQILFVEDGRIAERGNHAELMQLEQGRYRRFVELQRGGHRDGSLGA